MLRNRNIAFFIDVDNVDLTSENYDNIIAQLEGMGEIFFGKIYGAKERKHKEIYAGAELKGYKIERPMRIKRRGRKDFDSRIFVDVVDTVCRAPSVNAVCVITASCDLVYLYSYLHGKGIKIISSDEGEAASSAMVDEYVDLGRVYEIKLPASRPAPKKPVRPVTRPAVATATRSIARAAAKNVTEDKPVQQQDNTGELLKEIERLKRVAEEQQAEKEAKSKAADEARAKAEAEAKAREEERLKAQKAIEEARTKAREEAEAKAREEERANAKKAIEEARAKAREEAEAKAREEERANAKKAIEEAKAQAEAKAREEERARAQQAIEEARAKAREEAAARAREEERAKAEEEIRLKLAELAKSGGNNEELMRELEKLKSLTSETNQLVKEMKDEPKEKDSKTAAHAYEQQTAYEDLKAREDARRVIEEAKARTRAEVRAADQAQKELEEAKAKAEAEARAREEERLKAKKAIEEARIKASEEAAAKVREEERLRAQQEIEHWKSIAESQAEEPDSPSARYYMQRTDGKLLRKIEEINKGGNGGNDDELLATIQDLLDGLDD